MAAAAQFPGGVSAVGHQRSRLAGRARREDVPDSHDRRRHQRTDRAFRRHDSTEENMRLLWSYVEQHGRPVAFYTDKASLFQATPRCRVTGRNGTRPAEVAADADRERAAGTGDRLDGGAFAAGQGRVERSFGTAQDRLVKGMRIAG